MQLHCTEGNYYNPITNKQTNSATHSIHIGLAQSCNLKKFMKKNIILVRDLYTMTLVRREARVAERALNHAMMTSPCKVGTKIHIISSSSFARQVHIKPERLSYFRNSNCKVARIAKNQTHV